jgi:CMP-N,N'-diacetyllegionaminic acid synthase
VIGGKRLLGLVPARGGSIGIPRKNIRLLGDKPLIAWSIETARRSQYLDRIVVSTDDREIAAEALKFSADVPYIRPAELATSSAQAIDVILHALERIPDVDAVALLQPTSPFRSVEDIDRAIEKWSVEGVSVVSVVESSDSPYLMYQIKSNLMVPIIDHYQADTNRQLLPVTYLLNGAVYVASRSALIANRSFITTNTSVYIMPEERSIDLDTEADWKYAEFLLQHR